MNYDLALQLKKAGFPQKNGIFFEANGQYVRDVYLPDLSELIEACGDEFRTLEQVPDEDEYYLWFATTRDITVPLGDQLGYTTPEEAVALLWLELNKKKHKKEK